MNWIIRIVCVVSMLPLMAIQCYTEEGPNCHKRLDFENASNTDIYTVKIECDNDRPASGYDLSFNTYKYLKEYDGRNSYLYCLIPSHQTKTIIDMGEGCLERLLQTQSRIFFVLDAHIVHTSTAEELVDGRAVLDKILYTLDDIKAKGTLLVYE